MQIKKIIEVIGYERLISRPEFNDYLRAGGYNLIYRKLEETGFFAKTDTPFIELPPQQQNDRIMEVLKDINDGINGLAMIQNNHKEELLNETKDGFKQIVYGMILLFFIIIAILKYGL